jgi:hypothetical protein
LLQPAAKIVPTSADFTVGLNSVTCRGEIIFRRPTRSTLIALIFRRRKPPLGYAMELDPLAWQRLEALVRRDPSARGLASYLDDAGDPIPSDLEAAAMDLVAAGTRVLLVTGFAIITPDGPRAETDGPLGAIFLAGMLRACEIEVDIATDALAAPLVRAGLQAAGLDDVGLIEVSDAFEFDDYEAILGEGYSHLVAIERVGPNHTADSIAAQDQSHDEAQLAEFEQLVAPHDRDTCRNMRGDSIDDHTPPLHWLFEFDFAADDEDDEVELDDDSSEAEAIDEEAEADEPDTLAISQFTTIGIADGGNEIGCGNIPWNTLRNAVKTGPIALTACRIPTDYLIVAGISNWGAYGLGAAIAALTDRHDALRAWTADREASALHAIVAAGGVDGVLKRPESSVDGVALEPYLATFDEIRNVCLAS